MQLKQVTDRKKVYWEYGNDYSTCIPGTSNDGWHNMILMAGGINIFGDASLAGKDIDPEQILTEDPDLIVKIYAGKNVIGNSGVFTAPPQEEFAEKDVYKRQNEWCCCFFRYGYLRSGWPDRCIHRLGQRCF